MSSENNRGKIEETIQQKKDVFDFDEFCNQLQGWKDRKDSILEVARELNKSIIDSDVIYTYFGGKYHTKVVLEDIKKDELVDKKLLSMYIVFLHLLLPIKILSINKEKQVVSGIYENDEVTVNIENILYFKKDEHLLELGKIVLSHYPLIVDAAPREGLAGMLLKLQKEDRDFISACKVFSKGIDHAKYVYFLSLKKRVI